MRVAEWESCTHPLTMLDAIAGVVSERKLRLFACACCRQMWELLPNESRRALVTCEKFAEGLATEQELLAARQEAVEGYRRVDCQLSFKKRTVRPPARAALVVVATASQDAWQAAREAILASIDLLGRQQVELLREVVGNPFRPEGRGSEDGSA